MLDLSLKNIRTGISKGKYILFPNPPPARRKDLRPQVCLSWDSIAIRLCYIRGESALSSRFTVETVYLRSGFTRLESAF